MAMSGFSMGRHSQYEYLFEIAGRCHTSDEAYRVLTTYLEERLSSAEGAETLISRLTARVVGTKKEVEDDDDANEERIALQEAEKELEETNERLAQMRREVAFLERVLLVLQPFRRYAHLPDHEAAEACQREERALDLIFGAENYLHAGNTVPAQHWAEMRRHPDYDRVIFPHVTHLLSARAAGPLRRPAFLAAIEGLLFASEPKPERSDYEELPRPTSGASLSSVT